MKIKSVHIHNFRSIKDGKFDLYDYNVLVGSNNSGKSNVLTALRIFYEDEIKYDENSDFPKFKTDDNESWIEIEYVLSEEEVKSIKKEYVYDNNMLKVRKYLKSEDRNKVKANQSNIYAYENGKLSENLFYGARNISQAKLGTVIYIPALATTNETLKTTGPSPFRKLLNLIIKELSKKSKSFQRLYEEFEKFNISLKNEETEDGLSLKNIENKINNSLREWNVKFNVNIEPIGPDEVIKSLVKTNFIDETLNKEKNVTQYGLGLQRHLIYTLIRIASQIERETEEESNNKKDFSPDFTLILFEEPELFLHPTQQEILNVGLRNLASEENHQVLITTHSPIFVSKNIEEVSSIIKLKREEGVTEIFQITNEKIDELIKNNNELFVILKNKLDDPQTDEKIKERIRELIGETEEERRLEEESIRYLSWLDSERCCAFFADLVLICEGATEKVFIDYLIRNKVQKLNEKKIYVLDAMGKFNIHRYMNLFKELGIYHSVLMDKDENRNLHEIVNDFIFNNKNDYTKKIDLFEKNIEDFLNVAQVKQGWKKPINILWHYFHNKIEEKKLEDLIEKVKQLIE
ncbi:ATP-dependent nuclease [Caldicellulosiruptor acetigenus]|uniref:ATP-dependent nuclease n=1 Tax=Caldicellulosiruptor acetigenus TaxID=301953 RepID=UPI0004065F93|nr:AAA family ATPase [Caldicellulosiruptor acetigenus]WAM36519.1 AAA family ATPase [Caldicellulosiruptor acetigenus]